ncbi:MAG: universal stress protein [Ilumatobacteraceae bacterium]
MTRVLIALDPTDAAQGAAQAAAALFGPDAEYLAITVEADPQFNGFVWGSVYGYPYPPVMPANPELVDPSAALETAEDDAARLASEAGVSDVTAVGAVGDPVEAICRAAVRHHADVIVAGWHERTWLHRMFDRSVSEELIKQAAVPVLIVPLPHHHD